jgi:hypothetical protein
LNCWFRLIVRKCSLAKIEEIYPRLDEKQQQTLLQVLAKKIIVTPEGEIIDQELPSPFVYLRSIADDLQDSNPLDRGSEQVRLGAQVLKNRSADDVDWFLSMLRFDSKGKLGELPDLDLNL